MALATQCPHCNTTFRVAQDQLKLRAGLVRCGSCKEIFNGIEHLLPVDGGQAKPVSPPKSVTPVDAKPSEPVTQTPAAPPVPQAPEPAPAVVPEFLAKRSPVEEVDSPGIPISLLVSKPAPSASELDFAYPEPIPDVEAEPELAAEPMQKHAPEPEPQKTASTESVESETVEFVEFVEVPRAIKEHVVDNDYSSKASPEDPLTRMTLVDFTDTLPPDEQTTSDHENDAGAIDSVEQTPALDEPDPLDQVIEELKNKPLRGKKKRKPFARRPTPQIAQDEAEAEFSEPEISDAEEPDFVKQSRHQQTVGRTWRMVMGVASFILLLCLFVQATYTFRDLIAARVPETKSILQNACLLLGCKIGLPTQIEALSIESDQLETLNASKDVSEFTMLLRNNGPTAQAWPHLELTLNDANNSMLSRRVFAPHDYLPSTQDEKKGIASNTEQSIKLYIEFSGVKPAGYHVGVFYP